MPRTRRWQVAAVHLPLFLAISIGWMVGMGLLVVVVLLARDGTLPPDSDGVMTALGPVGIGVMSVVQMMGLAAAAVVLAKRLPHGPSAFPVVAERILLTTAVVGGLTVWTLPTLIAMHLEPLLGTGPSAAELLLRMLLEASVGGRLMIALAIAVSAPLLEEVVFRGYLWRVIEHSFAPWVAGVGTTVLFMAYHLDPVQSLALAPTAVYLGWLRWRSGSLLPPMAAHFVNNALAIGLALTTEGFDLPPWLAVVGFTLTIATGSLGSWIERHRHP